MLLASLLAAAAAAALILRPHHGVVQGAHPDPGNLPLSVSPVASASDTLVVLYSGDGGWTKIDRGMADGFVNAGLPVVGIDSQRYFWTARTPDGAAADLAGVLRNYMGAWRKSRVALVGYSFGADALPTIAGRLPEDLRRRIRVIALVGAGKTGQLKFTPRSWLGEEDGGAPTFLVGPALARLGAAPVLCIYGDEESDPACPGFASPTARPVRLPGGHHFGGDYARIALTVVRALPQ